MPDDIKFLKYKTKILAVNTGDQPDRLTHDIVVPTFRGYAPGDRIPAGTLLSAIIEKEFNSTPPTPKVTITVVGNGTTSPAAGTHNVTYGGDFTFNSATPATGYRLRDIVVDGETKTAPFTIRNITADKTIAVTFEEIPPTPTYTITATAGANGSINPSGAVSVDEGGSQTFTITPDSGYQIKDVKVDGASVGAVPSYTFNNVTASHTIDAEFEVIPATTYTVTASAGANGSVSPTGAQTVGEHGNITFTATPASGYVVDAWKLDGATQSETGTSFTVSNVTADHTVEVTFKTAPVTSHTITVTAGANGTISPAGPVTVSDGADQVFTITANSGYEIEDVKADGVSVGAVPDYTFTNVTADHTISATFKVIPVTTYTVTPSAGAGGSINPNTAQTVNSGGSVTFTATPDTGYKVKDWKLDGTSQSETGTTFTVSNVTADHTVAVEFEPETSKKLYIGHIVGSRGATVVPTSSNITIVTSEEKTDAELQALKASGWTVTHPARGTFSEYFVAYPAEMGALRAVTSVAAQLPDAYETETFDIDGVSCIVAYHPGCNKSGGEIKYEW